MNLVSGNFDEGGESQTTWTLTSSRTGHGSMAFSATFMPHYPEMSSTTDEFLNTRGAWLDFLKKQLMLQGKLSCPPPSTISFKKKTGSICHATLSSLLLIEAYMQSHALV